MKVVFFHRKPEANYFSVEGTFETTRKLMSEDIEPIVVQSRFLSRGFFRRLYNIIEAFFRQGEVNHITGDVTFLSFLLTKNKTLLTILDSQALDRMKGLKRKLYFLFWFKIPEKRVKLISTISQSSKNELVKLLCCDAEKIKVVPVCISPKYKKAPYKFEAEKPKILQVGTAENKNLERLCAAIEGLPCTLHIIGKLSKQQLMVLADKAIDFTNSFALSDEEMVAEYIDCHLVSFVSTYEGFGMPIIEANTVGRPVITSNLLSMPEVAGDSACLVDPFDINDIRAGLLRIMQDKEYRVMLIENGYKNANRFKPEGIAKQYSEIYRELYL
ncbi:MAG: hypothetical protein CMK41_06575 [Porticoccaceae bacterium]|nr:hypothetical protein [Porticoccaceae bacterium]|tara:strand:- start:36646 stop:37632 length:987 start_codon:yes stop_codon:yes gene_type:complete